MKNTIKLLSTFGLLGASITTSASNLKSNSNINEYISIPGLSKLPSLSMSGQQVTTNTQFLFRARHRQSYEATYQVPFIDYSLLGYSSFSDYKLHNPIMSIPTFIVESRVGYEPEWKEYNFKFSRSFSTATLSSYFTGYQVLTDETWHNKTKKRTTVAEIEMKLQDDKTSGIIYADILSTLTNDNHSEPVWNRGAIIGKGVVS